MEFDDAGEMIKCAFCAGLNARDQQYCRRCGKAVIDWATIKERYSGYYSDEAFHAKLKKSAHKAGRDVVERALVLYYGMELAREMGPDWAEPIFTAALGFFVAPDDKIPDGTPAIGFADDVAVMTVAMDVLDMHIPDSARKRAAKKANEMFVAETDPRE